MIGFRRRSSSPYREVVSPGRADEKRARDDRSPSQSSCLGGDAPRWQEPLHNQLEYVLTLACWASPTVIASVPTRLAD
jgi:hypothetical protein